MDTYNPDNNKGFRKKNCDILDADVILFNTDM